MFVSKHHYAVELARRGNKVYFLNPPDAARKDRIAFDPEPGYPGITVISHRLFFPYNIKFHAIGLFHWLMRFHIKAILRAGKFTPDIIWSFDLANLYPFHLFPSGARRIFHPVDEPLNATAVQSARGAQVIFSVTTEILDKYKAFDCPRILINHGVTEAFISNPAPWQKGEPLRVGFSGNLLRPDIDRAIFLEIVRANPAIIFECWGSYQLKDANMGGTMDDALHQFIASLQASPNVVLHGAVPSATLANEYKRMDAFLICYDIEKDQSKGTNYHKIMEYLGSGRVIIANNTTAYKDHPELLTMTEDRTNNAMLPGLFKQVLERLDEYNAPGRCEKRIQYARANTYTKQVMAIGDHLQKLLPA